MQDPDLLLDNERFVWVKRHAFRGEERSQLVVLMKGESPWTCHRDARFKFCGKKQLTNLPGQN